MIEYSDLPLSNLSEQIDTLCTYVLKDTSLPFWVTREQAMISTVASIKATLDHIVIHGNRW